MRKLRDLLDRLPADAMVRASTLGNIVVYDHPGPVDGRQIAYIDLLRETLHREPEPE